MTATFLPKRQAIVVFIAFAFAYFLSALIRAITATLSPTLSLELGLQARDLGLLAGGYFLGFAAMQLPMGKWLDKYGPKKVILSLLPIALLGSVAFSMSNHFYGLLIARIFVGIGVSACLMAPLTGYRRWLEPSQQQRANAWMLMTGSLGMVAATLPVQWLMPLIGWRGIFLVFSALVLLAILALLWLAPAWESPTASQQQTLTPKSNQSDTGYQQVWANPYFRSLIPIGFLAYGGLIALQTLWVTPWMIKVAGYSPAQAASGLFGINLTMLFTFWLWGAINPWLVQHKIHSDTLLLRGFPLSFVILAIIIIASQATNTPPTDQFGNVFYVLQQHIWILWALYFVGCSFVALTQPAIALVFPPQLAGRALSAFNLVMFLGVFVVQWSLGLLIDVFKYWGYTEVRAFQGAFVVYLICVMASYVYFAVKRPR
ncbi:MAG TPA: MFS transporter [Burkholderiaceae bacterium]|nr:MFS transporter [Burkholderiaceae bacterium]